MYHYCVYYTACKIILVLSFYYYYLILSHYTLKIIEIRVDTINRSFRAIIAHKVSQIPVVSSLNCKRFSKNSESTFAHRKRRYDVSPFFANFQPL